MENTYIRILNLDGSWFDFKNDKLTYDTEKERIYITKNGKQIKYKVNKNKLYSATMPYSLETIRAFKKIKDEIFTKNNEQFTNLFVNLKFEKDKIDNTDADNEQVKINKKRLRNLIYTSNITINNIEYRYFKRGASKARTANVIFCKKEYYDTLYTPCLLGLKFEEGKEYDITSLQAYVSLIMSGIIGTINIKANEILIINDLKSPSFKTKQNLTIKDNEDNIKQNEDTYDISNNMTDGEALMDESIFIENVFLNKSTCVLLRNDFFKGNACRTRLQDFWNSRQVWDKYRGWMDSSKIKLVITPSACKYLKFADQFKSEKECFTDWLNHINSTFGVVKTDHVGNYGYNNRLSYQMLNSINLSKSEVKEIMQDELKYYKFLKDNTLATSADIKKMTKKDKKINRNMRHQMSQFLDLVINSKEEGTTGDMIADLLKRNSDFRFTKKFKDWKNEQLQDYVSNLRLGKIRIKNSLYAIMISCPYEMLVATVKKDNKIDKCIMSGWECYCPRFEENAKLIAIRNPQINQGNIGYMVNKYHEEYKWVGYYENSKPQHNFVVFINTWDVDVMNRLQGCDFDIDSIFLSDSDILTNKAYDSQKWATPTNGIEGKKAKVQYNKEELAKLDNYLGGSTMVIGKIVNKSAIFNGYMYNAINNNYPKEYINACYNASSTLSSFSQIAIDMAKKNFKGLKLTKEMNILNKTSYKNAEGKDIQILKYRLDKFNEEGKEDKERAIIITLQDYIKDYIQNKKKYELLDEIENIDKLTEEYKNADKKNLPEIFNKKIKVYAVKMVVPYFFKYVAKDNTYRIPIKMKCSMDYLEEILDELDTKAIQADAIDIKDLFVMQKDLNGRAFSRNKIDNVRKIIDNCQFLMDKNMYNKTDNNEETNQKSNFRKWAKKEAVKELKDLDLNEKTIYRILLRAFNLDKDYKGQTLYKTDEKGNIIVYTDWDLEEEFNLTVKEFKEMTMLVLTLIYQAYSDNFIKCFKEKRMEKIKVNRFWI